MYIIIDGKYNSIAKSTKVYDVQKFKKQLIVTLLGYKIL